MVPTHSPSADLLRADLPRADPRCADAFCADASCADPPRADPLREPFAIGGVAIPNRLVLAPLAGIGNWFVRWQAKRYGAGLAVSEMISSHAIAYRNRRTLRELLRIDEREREGGPVGIQLFGCDPRIMAIAAREVASAGAEMIDLNMGCPVPKVCRTGAGAALLDDPERAIALVGAAREGSSLPVTAKLRCGRRAGDHAGCELAVRLVREGGAAAIALHPRAASARHAGTPDYALARELAREVDVPVILSGGMRDSRRIRSLFAQTGVAAVMLARGSLGNPWLFAELAHGREHRPCAAEVVDELEWVIARAQEHLGEPRACRYLRKHYPWYLARLGLAKAQVGALLARLQRLDSLAQVREELVRIERLCADC
jgi:tRNA-dihydrouridine synthase B